VELTIGVDVGGTKIAAGVVDREGRILARRRVSTPADTAESLDKGIASVVTALCAEHRVDGVGVAAAGFVDEGRSTVRFAANLPPWRDHPLRDILSEHIHVPIAVENDANAAAWAEYRFGAGQGVADVVVITVGTGIGAGIVIDGRLVRGAWGIAAEPGHMRVVPDGRLCGCGLRGCWEQYASGKALLRQARLMVEEEPAATAALLRAAGGRPEALTGPMISAAAADGDPAALELLAETGRRLGEGIATVAAILDPAVIVIGGGVGEAGEVLLGPARETFVSLLSGAAYRPLLDIRQARLGNDAGIVGAADLARQP
jgi:glucokinase